MDSSGKLEQELKKIQEQRQELENEASMLRQHNRLQMAQLEAQLGLIKGMRTIFTHNEIGMFRNVLTDARARKHAHGTDLLRKPSIQPIKRARNSCRFCPSFGPAGRRRYHTIYYDLMS